VEGVASWYAAHGAIAAAGPVLRHALGAHWRGSVVRVCAGDRCVTVTVSDWCQCYRGEDRERMIDLSDDTFARLAPLSRGVLDVVVRW
jgi:rare lipoprotein A (peptidoglycan hydrolase)